MHADPPRLSRLLSQLWRCCPTLERPVTGTFVSLWQDHIDGALAASMWSVPRRLILNREVLATAAGPEGESYRERARANVLQLEARLGRPSQDAAAETDAAHWHRWCRWWAQGRQGASPHADWVPSQEGWRVIHHTCALLCGGSADQLEYLAIQADQPGDADRPLSYLRRLARIERAGQLICEERYADARRLALSAGSDGERLLATAAAFTESSPEQLSLIAAHARKRAYQASRLASQLDTLDYSHAATFWREEQTAWRRVAVGMGERNE